jgi:ubiquinol-cytochrome c reductase cytochrome b subunit
MLTLGVVALHVAALHVVGSNNPTGVDLPPAQMAPFHPHHTGKSLLAMLVFLLVFVVLAFFFPMSLTQNDNFVPANPASTPASIAPAWYFLQFYAILRAIPGIGGVTLAIGSVLVLFAVPWLDSSPVRSARYRPRYRIAMFVLILDAILLSLAGSEQTAGIWMPIARLATLWWFFHFLVLMPYLGRHERTLPLPTLVGAR